MRKSGLTVLLVVGIGVTVAYAEDYIPDPHLPKPIQEHGRCSANAGNAACWGYAIRDNIPKYSQPNIEAKIVGRSQPGVYISLLEPSESKAHPGWVPVVGYMNEEYVVAWVRHTDMALATDLRRVVGCWPIKMIGWYEEGAGDYDGGEFRLLFDTSGAILPTSHGYALEDRADYIAKNLAVYYARGVFRIRHLTEPMGDLPGLAPIFGLNYQNRHVTVSAPAMETFFEFFPDEALKGCADIPQVDPKQGIKFK